MRQKFMRVLTYALPAINGGAVFVLGASRANWPSGQFWSVTVIAWALVAAGATPIVQSYIAERGEKRRRLALEREERVRAFLAASLMVIANECKAPWQDTGIQAFLLTSWGKRRRHTRIAKIRLSSIPASGVRWTKGKGVIGRCWETRREQWAQLDGEFAQLSSRSRLQWLTLTARETYGLTYDEFQTIGTKYGTVAAVPIIGRNDEYIGCITLDTPSGVTVDNQKKALESLTATAEFVRRLVEA